MDVAYGHAPLTFRPTSGPEFIKFLKYLSQDNRKYVIVMDTTLSHKSHLVQKHLEDNKDGIIPLYLPEYTPRLNPIGPNGADEEKEAILDIHIQEELVRILRVMLYTGDLRPIKIPEHYVHAVTTRDCTMPLPVPKDYAAGCGDSSELSSRLATA